MTFEIDTHTCECAAKGIPEGYICGKPECPRVISANAMLANIHESLYGNQMTANNETRFRCDRCETDTVLPVDSGGPAHGRMSGPSDWLMLRLGTDPSTPPSHLCEKCKVLFMQFMEKPSG